MHLSPQEDAIDLLKNRRFFLQFNQHKIERALNTFSEPDRMIFMVIPRLLHVNQKGLPGYLGEDVPCGIHNYTIDPQTLFFAEKLFPAVIIRRHETLTPAIHSLLLVGSVGSIAQNQKSDLDYTLLVDKSRLSENDIALLKRKLKLIERWVMFEFDLETHFFINDIQEVKNNIFGESDSESTGSALAKLLKEEMYRTMIVAAGKIPFWWIVPVRTDNNEYDNLFQRVSKGETLLDGDDFIDIGNIADISDGEFFGGSIWTLIKSFNSPFKTLLKMGLLEEYMFNKTSFNLLCHQIKEKVFSGDHSYQVDPYLMLYERVENFFQETKSSKEMDALRVAFYMKIGTQVDLDQLDTASNDSKLTILKNKLDLWGWPISKLEHLNTYKNWQMNQKVAMGNRVNKILMKSYEAISERNKSLDPSDTLITKKDTHLLGRKLFSFYRKIPNKVENLFSLVEGNTAETALTFLLDKNSPIKNPVWYLVRGKTMNVDKLKPENIIKTASSLQFLIAFTAFNKLFQKSTDIFIRPESLSITTSNLHIMLNQIDIFLGQVSINAIHNDDLLSSVRITKLYMIVDFGIIDPSEIILGDIHQCKSNTDLKRFITPRIDKIKNLTTIYLTSWGELFCKTYSGPNLINRCVEELSSQIVLENNSENNFLKVFIPSKHCEILQVPWLTKYLLRAMKNKKIPLANQKAS
ncbi:MAG: class I adenylate cyclase [Nitrospinae bacterium]|nr:class I adenylate cyclase [Nitrospinota bacterium]MDA1108529.1 class I adenylate cyclase [Nitrospinota bacterium]